MTVRKLIFSLSHTRNLPNMRTTGKGAGARDQKRR
jgi:hypothetical protein